MKNNTHHIYHTLFIDAPIEKVFDAVSKPEHLIHWWPLECTGIAKENETYNFYFSPDYNWYGKVSAIEPNTLFSIYMTTANENWNNTTFSFYLSKHNNHVKLQFSHCNWPENNEHFKISSFCWAILLKGLKDYLEKGTIIPFKERS